MSRPPCVIKQRLSINIYPNIVPFARIADNQAESLKKHEMHEPREGFDAKADEEVTVTVKLTSAARTRLAK